MSDTAPDTGTPEAATPNTLPPEHPLADPPKPDTGSDDVEQLKAEVDKYKALHRKQEERAKANADAARELEKLRQSTMSDQEKAVATAKAEGYQQARVEFGVQMVDAELRVAAVGRLDDKALGVLLQGLNRQAFLNDDGTVDSKSVAQFVDGIAPKPPEPKPQGFPDLGQGARNDVALNSDSLLRDLKSAVGIR